MPSVSEVVQAILNLSHSDTQEPTTTRGEHSVYPWDIEFMIKNQGELEPDQGV